MMQQLKKRNSSSARNWLILAVLVSAFLLVLPARLDSYLMHIFILIFLSAYLAQCWNILSGIAGQFSFGHAAFFGIGAYATAVFFVDFKIIPWFGIILAGLLAALVAVGIGYLCFRYGLKGAYFTLAILAFAEIFRILVHNIKALRGPLGILLPLNDSWLYLQFSTRINYYYIAFFLMVLITVFTYWMMRSKLGSYFAAIKENEDAAEMLGVNTTRYKIFCMGISAFLTSVGGSFYALYMFYIDPHIAFGVERSISILVPAVIGGMGTVFGPVLGAFVLTPLAEFTRSYLGDYGGVHLMVYGAVLIVVVIFLPNGLMGLIKQVFARFTAGKDDSAGKEAGGETEDGLS